MIICSKYLPRKSKIFLSSQISFNECLWWCPKPHEIGMKGAGPLRELRGASSRRVETPGQCRPSPACFVRLGLCVRPLAALNDCIDPSRGLVLVSCPCCLLWVDLPVLMAEYQVDGSPRYQVNGCSFGEVAPAQPFLRGGPLCSPLWGRDGPSLFPGTLWLSQWAVNCFQVLGAQPKG